MNYLLFLLFKIFPLRIVYTFSRLRSASRFMLEHCLLALSDRTQATSNECAEIILYICFLMKIILKIFTKKLNEPLYILACVCQNNFYCDFIYTKKVFLVTLILTI